jgi:Uma2 family endonuclease
MELVALQTESINLTDEQFLKLCLSNKELRFERDKDKNIIIMAPTFTETGNYNSELGTDLGIWNRKKKLGYCFDSNAGFTLPNGAVRSPDVSWILKERYDKVIDEAGESFAHICPDFVIELMSKNDSLKKTMEKMEEWKENGCQLGWLIDCNSRITYVYRPNQEPTQHSFTETLSGEKILPGFKLKMEEIISK